MLSEIPYAHVDTKKIIFGPVLLSDISQFMCIVSRCCPSFLSFPLKCEISQTARDGGYAC